MKQQKVITVNVNTNEDGEFELDKVNKYLDEGYDIKSVYQTVPSGSSSRINLTFILEKEEMQEVRPLRQRRS